jgi:hypothetical protein
MKTPLKILSLIPPTPLKGRLEEVLAMLPSCHNEDAANFLCYVIMASYVKLGECEEVLCSAEAKYLIFDAILEGGITAMAKLSGELRTLMFGEVAK